MENNSLIVTLKNIYDLWDGVHFVKRSELIKHWPECPTHSRIMNMSRDTFLDFDFNLDDPGYMPTAIAIELIESRHSSSSSLKVNAATLVIASLSFVVAVATLLVTLFK